jgi:DNA-binding PadR family transcriptional regulator
MGGTNAWRSRRGAAPHLGQQPRARFYTLTAVGRRQLAAERKEIERVVTAIHAVLELA